LVTSTYLNNKPIIGKKFSNLKFIKVNLKKPISLKENYDLSPEYSESVRKKMDLTNPI
jgi:hypothetical protein